MGKGKRIKEPVKYFVPDNDSDEDSDDKSDDTKSTTQEEKPTSGTRKDQDNHAEMEDKDDQLWNHEGVESYDSSDYSTDEEADNSNKCDPTSEVKDDKELDGSNDKLPSSVHTGETKDAPKKENKMKSAQIKAIKKKNNKNLVSSLDDNNKEVVEHIKHKITTSTKYKNMAKRMDGGSSTAVDKNSYPQGENPKNTSGNVYTKEKTAFDIYNISVSSLDDNNKEVVEHIKHKINTSTKDKNTAKRMDVVSSTAVVKKSYPQGENLKNTTGNGYTKEKTLKTASGVHKMSFSSLDDNKKKDVEPLKHKIAKGMNSSDKVRNQVLVQGKNPTARDNNKIVTDNIRKKTASDVSLANAESSMSKNVTKTNAKPFEERKDQQSISMYRQEKDYSCKSAEKGRKNIENDEFRAGLSSAVKNVKSKENIDANNSLPILLDLTARPAKKKKSMLDYFPKAEATSKPKSN